MLNRIKAVLTIAVILTLGLAAPASAEQNSGYFDPHDQGFGEFGYEITTPRDVVWM